MKKRIGVISRILISIALLGNCMDYAKGQEIAVKSNLFYAAYSYTPNLGAELKLNDRLSLDLSVGYNPFNRKGSIQNNKKAVHWLIQPEVRYWLCEAFNGHYFGAHLLGSQFNISQHNLPLLFGKGSKEYRYEGWATGLGISYGYQLPLAKHWNAEFSVGVGYAYMNYDKFLCPKCGEKLESGASKHYFGPTKAAISIIYLIK